MYKMASKERLDQFLVKMELASSRSQAQALIMAGIVLVNGQLVQKPGTMIAADAKCEIIKDNKTKYVSRGGLKLEKALHFFNLQPEGKIALDIGASTGGFTDCLLQHGAQKIYALDVGYGQLAWKLRNDPRVISMERTNIRDIASLPEVSDCCVIDVSFISLHLVLPHLCKLISPGAWIVALVKPQFEAGKQEVDRGAGIIKDLNIHRRVLTDNIHFASTMEIPLYPQGLTVSPITGRDGNREYLLWLSSRQAESFQETDIERALAEHVDE